MVNLRQLLLRFNTSRIDIMILSTINTLDQTLNFMKLLTMLQIRCNCLQRTHLSSLKIIFFRYLSIANTQNRISGVASQLFRVSLRQYHQQKILHPFLFLSTLILHAFHQILIFLHQPLILNKEVLTHLFQTFLFRFKLIQFLYSSSIPSILVVHNHTLLLLLFYTTTYVTKLMSPSNSKMIIHIYIFSLVVSYLPKTVHIKLSNEGREVFMFKISRKNLFGKLRYTLNIEGISCARPTNDRFNSCILNSNANTSTISNNFLIKRGSWLFLFFLILLLFITIYLITSLKYIVQVNNNNMKRLFTQSLSKILKNIQFNNNNLDLLPTAITQTFNQDITYSKLNRLPTSEVKNILKIPCPVNNTNQPNTLEQIKVYKRIRYNYNVSEEAVCFKCQKNCPLRNIPFKNTEIQLKTNNKSAIHDFLNFFIALSLIQENIYSQLRWSSAYKVTQSFSILLRDIKLLSKQSLLFRQVYKHLDLSQKQSLQSRTNPKIKQDQNLKKKLKNRSIKLQQSPYK